MAGPRLSTQASCSACQLEDEAEDQEHRSAQLKKQILQLHHMQPGDPQDGLAAPDAPRPRHPRKATAWRSYTLHLHTALTEALEDDFRGERPHLLDSAGVGLLLHLRLLLELLLLHFELGLLVLELGHAVGPRLARLGCEACTGCSCAAPAGSRATASCSRGRRLAREAIRWSISIRHQNAAPRANKRPQSVSEMVGRASLHKHQDLRPEKKPVIKSIRSVSPALTPGSVSLISHCTSVRLQKRHEAHGRFHFHRP